MSPEQEKMEKMYQAVMDIKTHIARSEVHMENHASEIKDLRERTSKIEEDRHKAVGAVTVFGGLGFLSGIGSLIVNLFNK